ncbi:MAG: hypothetical protein ABI852_11265, partial [Gemmatimonadaceae bacterium]
LIAYSAPDSASATKLLANSPVVARVSAVAGKASGEKTFWLYRITTLIPIILLLIAVAGMWFFRMSMWASEVLPTTDVGPVASEILRERLMAVNKLDVPFAVAPLPDDSSVLVVTWRYADAKWVDLARLRGMKRTHRILMKLDDDKKTVRPTEQFSSLDWSAGNAGGSTRWATARGIVFFQYEHQRVFGLQIDSLNRFTPNLSYSYTFNLQEMKAPLIQAVTQSGWKWRPTLLHGPKWLSWLTD